MITDLKEFWTKEHRGHSDRWVSASDPVKVIERLGVNLDGVKSVLEVGPGRLLLANLLESMGKRVVLYDLVELDDPRYVSKLPLDEPVDLAIAHLVFQHVPQQDHHNLIRDVISSLRPGGKFHYDVVAADRPDPALLNEFTLGTSFPFTAWDLITDKREIMPGYYFCVSQA